MPHSTAGSGSPGLAGGAEASLNDAFRADKCVLVHNSGLIAMPSVLQRGMPLSARNQLPGTVKEIQIGDIMAHVVVKVGSNLVESVITRNSAEELGLKKGDKVRVVVKSTEVMIQKD
jgi:molybdate transport system regulatory protein